jgi:UDP-N-acetylglucosamine 3-dehydrogenase
MTVLRVGIIGCGRPWGKPGATGTGMAHHHAEGYEASPDAIIVALADINLENAQVFREEHGGDRMYEDYREMLAEESLDIVSISTWPHLHAEMVIAAAEAGVKAIHCEKPMAPTWGEAQRMVQVCQEHGVQLTFNHQRRFGSEYRKAKELLKAGAIGELRRMEGGCPDLFDWGTHWFDMLFFYNDETPVEWVIGQVEAGDGRTVFDVRMEEQGISHFGYRNGVEGLLVTRHGDFVGYNRLFGDEGVIEIDMRRKPSLRVWGEGQSAWQEVPTEETEAVKLGVLDLIDALKTGREPELSGFRALRATELSFATYESSRRRGRVELPLEVDVAPFPVMPASGDTSE